MTRTFGWFAALLAASAMALAPPWSQCRCACCNPERTPAIGAWSPGPPRGEACPQCTDAAPGVVEAVTRCACAAGGHSGGGDSGSCVSHSVPCRGCRCARAGHHRSALLPEGAGAQIGRSLLNASVPVQAVLPPPTIPARHGLAVWRLASHPCHPRAINYLFCVWII